MLFFLLLTGFIVIIGDLKRELTYAKETKNEKRQQEEEIVSHLGQKFDIFSVLAATHCLGRILSVIELALVTVS